jgi:hypothetical protein
VVAVAERSRRFRRLRRPDSASSGTGTTGDLFAHFGVEIEPDRTEAEPDAAAAVVDARPCRTCRWYVMADDAQSSCPICAEPRPWGDPPATEPNAAR